MEENKKKLGILKRRITLLKRKLSKTKRYDITENFGQKEVRKLRDYANSNDLYWKGWEEVNTFDDWVSNFEGVN